jgi:hypothetical protein
MYNVPMVNPGFRHVQYGLCSRKKKVAVNRLKKNKNNLITGKTHGSSR